MYVLRGIKDIGDVKFAGGSRHQLHEAESTLH